MTPIDWPRFSRSIQHAWRGLRQAAASENNFRIHSSIAIGVVLLTIGLKIPPAQASMIVIVTASVLILELVNTVVERFADVLEPRIHPYVQIIKDLMAAAVFLAALSALIVGIMIFWPYLRSWVS